MDILLRCTQSSLKNKVVFVYDEDLHLYGANNIAISSTIGDTFLEIHTLDEQCILYVGMGLKRPHDASGILQVIQEHRALDQIDSRAISAMYDACKRYKWTEFAIEAPSLHSIKRIVSELHKFNFQPVCFSKEPSKTMFAIKTVELEVGKYTNEISKELEHLLKAQNIISGNINYARYLAGLPSNICNIAYLVNEATTVASQSEAIILNQLDHVQLGNLGMNCLLAVGEGSQQDTTMVTMEYMKGDPKVKPIILVGKGIVYDTGGLSLKPTAGMICMGYDMSGAASILAIMKTLDEMDIRINVIGVMPLAENSIGSRSYKPGDVIKSMSGQFVEIGNTDAEGRLILCDAMTYAQKAYDTSLIFTIATLTGATLTGLGDGITPVYSTNTSITGELLKISVKTHDVLWPMPFFEGYDSYIKSDIADMCNINTVKPGYAGSLTAAMFLKRFLEPDCHLVHLDIARMQASSEHRSSRNCDICIETIIEYLRSAEELITSNIF